MAKQYARISREQDGRLAIALWHADGRNERSTVYIDSKQEWFDVPYAKWTEHIGQTVDLSEWVGSGEGMIGGPTRTEVAGMLYCGILSRLLPWSNSDEVRLAVTDLEDDLRDDRYDYSPEVRGMLESYIAKGYAWLNRRQTKAG